MNHAKVAGVFLGVLLLSWNGVLAPEGGLSQASTESQASVDLGGTWEGTYYIPALLEGGGPYAPSVRFKATFQQDGEAFVGRIEEPNTFGSPDAEFLYADVEGTVEDGTIEFTKTYDGTGGVGHSVKYSGTVSDAGDHVEGKWIISPTWSDRFEMRRQEEEQESEWF